nr:MAG TPA: hypothetical protein [Caudoviricetes sp.]
MCLANVIVKAFYPLLQGLSSHNGMLIHSLFSIYFHLYLEMSRARGFIIFFLTTKRFRIYALQTFITFKL